MTHHFTRNTVEASPIEWENDFDDDDREYRDAMEVCPRCHGSGITVEGFDCEFCDGDGYIEI
jgi:hypothetical protein